MCIRNFENHNLSQWLEFWLDSFVLVYWYTKETERLHMFGGCSVIVVVGEYLAVAFPFIKFAVKPLALAMGI